MSKKLVFLIVFIFMTFQIVMAIGLNEIVPGEYYNLTDYERLTGKKITKFNEAPMLKEMVEKGLLPPVEERLPKNPVVVTPYEEIGQYGGTWRRTWRGFQADRWGVLKISDERLVFLDKSGGSVIPGIAESWSMSPDGKEFTFKIREGLRWSDGEEVTTEDVRFWYEDVLLNEEITPSIPGWLLAGGKPPKVEIIDKYTFKFIFEVPNPLFIGVLATEGSAAANLHIILPSHYLKKMHPKYTPLSEIEEKAKEAGLTAWYQYFRIYGIEPDAWLRNPDLPVLFPWKVESPNEQYHVLVRNPYYYKIDPEGNQLPYIDRVVHYYVTDPQITALKVFSGEIDMQIRGIVIDPTLLYERSKEGNYRVLKWRGGEGAGTALYININVKEPVLREIFNDVRFRQAISLAINREEINALVYKGLAEPRQASIPTGAAFYDPEWERLYAEYDPEKANKLLDEIGLKWNETHEIRLRPDGKPLEITLLYAVERSSDALEMIANQLQKVGIKLNLRPLERSLRYSKCEAGDYEITEWSFDKCVAAIYAPYRILGLMYDGTWAPLYARWYISGGKAGEEPPEGSDMRKLYEIWDKVQTTVDEQERNELFKQIIELHKKNLWVIGIVGEGTVFGVVKNNVGNVPDGLLWDDPLRSPKNARPEQFFFKE
jgi:peptide/nickel transport system substrate-binding protein